jgi:ABC-type multidrug transport system permease subunit
MIKKKKKIVTRLPFTYHISYIIIIIFYFKVGVEDSFLFILTWVFKIYLYYNVKPKVF